VADFVTRLTPLPKALTVSREPWPISVVTFLVVWPIERPASFISAQADNKHNAIDNEIKYFTKSIMLSPRLDQDTPYFIDKVFCMIISNTVEVYYQ
jgi:hypothetical protein